MFELKQPPADAASERRMNFIAAAREAFFTHGYAGTTMSSIASSVGGSKTTLWSYFPSKEDLFAAVVDDIVAKFGAALSVPLPLDQPVETVLRRFGATLLQTLMSAPILALFRLVVSEAGRFPHLAELFFERGPRRGKARLAHYIDQCMVLGELREGDPVLAAHQFAGLVQCRSYERALLNLPPPTSTDELDEEIGIAVATFLQIWRPKPLTSQQR